MAVKAVRVSVATTATALFQADTVAASAILVRNRGTAAVYLGAADVTTATGAQLDPGESATVEADTHPIGLYGICASGTVVCHVLQVGT